MTRRFFARQASLGILGRPGGFPQKGNVYQHYGNYVQSDHYRTYTQESVNINIHTFELLSKRNIPVNKAIIAGGRLNVNNSTYFEGSTFVKPGEISTTPNHPEARLIESSESALRNVLREMDTLSR